MDVRTFLFLAICLINLQQCQTWRNTTLKQAPILNVILGTLNSVEASLVKSFHNSFCGLGPLLLWGQPGSVTSMTTSTPSRTAEAHGTAEGVPGDAVNESTGFSPLVNENRSLQYKDVAGKCRHVCEVPYHTSEACQKGFMAKGWAHVVARWVSLSQQSLHQFGWLPCCLLTHAFWEAFCPISGRLRKFRYS